MMKTQRARRRAGTRSAPTQRATIRIMGDAAAVETTVARLAVAGFEVLGRARLRDDPGGLRVYGVLSDVGEDDSSNR